MTLVIHSEFSKYFFFFCLSRLVSKGKICDKVRNYKNTFQQGNRLLFTQYKKKVYVCIYVSLY